VARKAKLSKSEITERLSRVFQFYGYEGASLNMLAEAAELSKASLYHYFPKGKEDMAFHVLGQAGARLQALVLAPLSGDASPSERLYKSLKGTSEYYSGDIPVCLMNSILLGAGTELFGTQISAAVEIWRQGLADTYKAAGAYANEAVAWSAYAVERIQGALILCRVKGMREPLEICLAELEADVGALAN